MAEQRLPVIDGDDGVWGIVLNQFLSKEHYNTGSDNSLNGGHQNVTIRPGTASAGTAPLKFSSGTLLTTPEAGAVEFYYDKLYFTKTTGPTRLTVATYDDTSGGTGDLYYRDASGNFVRLPVGSNGQVLQVSGGIPTWVPASASGITRSITTTSSSLTAGSSAGVDYTYLVSGTTTITLPTAVSNTNMYTVTNAGTNTVTVATTSSQTIDGSTSVTLPIANMSLSFVSTGTNWMIQ